MQRMIIIFIIGALLILVLGPYIFPAIYYVIALLALYIFTGLDQGFSVPLFPACPWLMWLVWGAILGAILGFWTVASIYGLRKYRPYFILIPLVLMGIVALLRVL
jgi:hypothetical protein